MTDEQFEALVQETAREYNRPPDTPRDRIWTRIRNARVTKREHAQATRRVSERKRRRDADHGHLSRARWRWLPIAGAAAIAVGILIGRMWPADRPTPPAPAITQDHLLSGDSEPLVHTAGRDVGAYRRAAEPYLNRVETLLTRINSDGRDRESAWAITDWAGELLSETRLLMNSPAREDEQLRLLLGDLELVLVQIVRLSGQSTAQEEHWIRKNLIRRSILPRLRNKIPPAQTSCGT